MCANITIQPLRIRRVTARPAELTRDSRSERPLPAGLGEPASVPAASSLGYAYGMHASRRQQQACVGKAAARGMCTFVAMVIGDLIEVTAPNGFRLPLMCSENRACFGGYCMLMPSIAGEQPKLCRSAAGNPRNRSLRSTPTPFRRERVAAARFRAVLVVFLRWYAL